MRPILLALGLFAALIAPAKASSITYGVNFQGSAFSIVGTITTDGTTGRHGTIAPLSNSDVTAYNLAVSIFGSSTTYDLACRTACYASTSNTTPIGDAPLPTGPALFATRQYLLFNFVSENSNYIVLGQNTYPSNYVEFYDHVLHDSTGMPDDEGPGAVQVGGGDGYPSVRTDFSLGNLQEYSSDGAYIIGTVIKNGKHKNSSTFNLSVDDSLDGPATPPPAALPRFATGIGGLGLLGWRRKRMAQAVA